MEMQDFGNEALIIWELGQLFHDIACKGKVQVLVGKTAYSRNVNTVMEAIMVSIERWDNTQFTTYLAPTTQEYACPG